MRGLSTRWFRFTTFLVAAMSFLSSPIASAQSALLDLPRASQRAVVSQRVGITNITLRYHRPLAKGRKVFGTLEPYGKVWRAGANENSIFEVSDPVTIEGKPLPKGVYGLHMIPGETEWTIIFSKNSTSWGSFTYDQSEDALRVTVKPNATDFHDALTYDFDDLQPNSATVTMRWDKVAVPFKVEVNTSEIVQQSLKNQLRGRAQYEWQAGDEAATYLLESKGNMDDALKYVNSSVQLEERFENLMTKARVLDSLNRNDEAKSARAKAMSIGTAIQLHSYGRQLQGQGKQDQAFEIFRVNIKRNPDHWTAHNEAARLAVSTGDFDTALKEMKLATAAAPDQIKSALQGLIPRLEKKDDINK
jgi:tetratricopeptide (TPR) repeat protein